MAAAERCRSGLARCPLRASSGLLPTVIAIRQGTVHPRRRWLFKFRRLRAAHAQGHADESSALRILLVDDEALIRMMVADMLEELGHSVAAEAGELDHALTLARSADLDLAILDFNLSGDTIDPVAEAIIARQIPFIFATGYSSPSIAIRFSQIPRLRKPYGIGDLGSAIDRTIAGGTNKGTVA